MPLSASRQHLPVLLTGKIMELLLISLAGPSSGSSIYDFLACRHEENKRDLLCICKAILWGNWSEGFEFPK